MYISICIDANLIVNSISRHYQLYMINYCIWLIIWQLQALIFYISKTKKHNLLYYWILHFLFRYDKNWL